MKWLGIGIGVGITAIAISVAAIHASPYIAWAFVVLPFMIGAFQADT